MKILSVIAVLIFGSLCLAAKGLPQKKPKTNKQTQEASEAEEHRQAEEVERERAESERIASEMKKDKRRPSKANISGNWSTGSNLAGTNFRLEQDGEKVSGRGFNWGCLGIYSPVKISGTYRGDLLELTFTESNGKKFQYRMTFTEKDGYPRFESISKNVRRHFEACYEIEEQNAKQQ